MHSKPWRGTSSRGAATRLGARLAVALAWLFAFAFACGLAFAGAFAADPGAFEPAAFAVVRVPAPLRDARAPPASCWVRAAARLAVARWGRVRGRFESTPAPSPGASVRPFFSGGTLTGDIIA